MDDLKPLLPGKLHGLGRMGDDGLRTGDKSKNPHLAMRRSLVRIVVTRIARIITCRDRRAHGGRIHPDLLAYLNQQ